MQNSPAPLRRAAGVLHSVWLIIFLTYLLDAVIYPLGLQFLGPPAFWFLIPLKVYLYSGIYGNLTEMASGEEILFNFENFHKNARQLWRTYAALTIFSFAIEFFLNSILSPAHPLAATIFARHIDIILLIILIQLIAAQKYIDHSHLGKIKVRLNLKTVGVIFLLYSVEMLLFYQPQIFTVSSPSLNNLFSLSAKYIHFLEFLYFSFIILGHDPQITEKFTSGKELYLIFPNLNGREGPLGDFASRFVNYRYPAMFVVLKALTPSHYRIRKFNKVIWQDRYFQGDKLVAISCFSSNCAEAYRLAREFKKRGSKVVMGGPHVSYLPAEALEFCDSVVVGEAEGVWEQLIKDYEANSLKKIYSGGRVEECHHLVYQELLNSPPHIIKDFLETSRGCKFKCHFCMIPTINEGKPRNHPTFELVELIKKITPRYRQVTFIDNNIYNDPGYARELFKALKPLNIKWYSPCTIDIAKNEETLRLAKESGCDTLLIGYEVPAGSLKEKRGGKLGMVDHYIEYTKKIHEQGIKIKATFTLGWELQNFRGLIQLYKFCLILKPFLVIPFLITPFPGTPFFEEMIRKNRIINLNWKKFNQWHMVIRNDLSTNTLFEHSFAALASFAYLFLSRLGQALLFVLLLGILPFLTALVILQGSI